MTDIKELALKVAKDIGYWDEQEEYILDFATRLIAAYTEGQEPVGEVIGFFEDNKMPRVSWFDAYPNKGTKLFTAPPEPAPQQQKPQTTIGDSANPAQPAAVCAAPLNAPPSANWTEDFGHENGQYQCKCFKCEKIFIGHKRRVVCKLCAAPSSEEVRDAVARLSDGFYDLDEGDCKRISDLIERLAARVPDGCVVVGYLDGRGRFFYADDPHMETDHTGMREVIAAGEVK